jgi:iron complex transport system substrate-binding protein
LFIQCKEETKNETKITSSKNEIQYAKGLEIYKHQGFSILKITNPWPEAAASFTYILQEKNGIIPDSLKQFMVIPSPLK